MEKNTKGIFSNGFRGYGKGPGIGPIILGELCYWCTPLGWTPVLFLLEEIYFTTFSYNFGISFFTLSRSYLTISIFIQYTSIPQNKIRITNYLHVYCIKVYVYKIIHLIEIFILNSISKITKKRLYNKCYKKIII